MSVKEPSSIIPPHRTSTLYFTDLSPTVSESHLIDLLTKIAPIQSLKYFYDRQTKRPKGSGYINCYTPEEASKIYEYANFRKIDNSEMRIMFSQPDASVRKSGVGNLFVKNLEPSLDNRSFYNLFSTFGVILSSKVMVDPMGKSMGYGFVHFQDPAMAEKALNDEQLKTKKMVIEKFKPASQRHGGKPNFTNLYVKNVDKNKFIGIFPDQKSFVDFFEKFGEITSSHFPLEDDQTPRGFGFVNFKNPEDAKKAIETVHEAPPHHLYVCRSLSKANREKMLRDNWAKIKDRKDAETAGRNLFVKNIPEFATEDNMRELFKDFGEIESLKIAVDASGNSKCFGYILYKERESASIAIKKMCNYMWNRKNIYVGYFQRKHVRNAQSHGFGKQKNTYPDQRNGYPTYGGYSAPAQILYPGSYMFNNPQMTQFAQRGTMMPNVAIPSAAMQQQHQYQEPKVYTRQPAEQNIDELISDRMNNMSALGEIILEKVRMISRFHAEKVTGMFLEMKDSDLSMLLGNEELFRVNVEKAIRMIENPEQKE